jgi:hypothetical protein
MRPSVIIFIVLLRGFLVLTRHKNQKIFFILFKGTGIGLVLFNALFTGMEARYGPKVKLKKGRPSILQPLKTNKILY